MPSSRQATLVATSSRQRLAAQDLGQHRPAVHVRHDQIEDDEPVTACRGLPQRLRAVTGEIDCIPGDEKRPADEVTDSRLIIHEQDA